MVGQAVAPAPHRGAHRTGGDRLDESMVEAEGQAGAQRAGPDLDPGWSTIRRVLYDNRDEDGDEESDDGRWSEVD